MFISFLILLVSFIDWCYKYKLHNDGICHSKLCIIKSYSKLLEFLLDWKLYMNVTQIYQSALVF